ncbi:MAG: repair protein RadA [Frondihabitans sp.]|nr:repair protein RadA [Frondihabitans sp.]
MSARTPAVFNASWLMEQDFPPIKYVVPGIIPEGMTLLVASPKIGKSWMVLGLALDLHAGRDAFGSIPVGRPRPVFYLALEDGPRRLQDRIRILKPIEINTNLTFNVSVPADDVVATIRNYLATHDGQDAVVILDTLGKVMPSSGSKTQYAADYDFLGALKSTCDAVPGSSLIIVHHTRKLGGEDFLDAVSGTNGIAGSADTVLVLKRDRQAQDGTLHVTSRDAHEGEYAVNLTDGRWTLVGGSIQDAARAAQTAQQTSGVGDRMADIITVIGRYEEGISVQDIKVLLPNIPVGQVDTYLKRAVEAERIVRTSRGRYAPV